ncbi:Porin subfamily protein [Symmachiella dynata]|nr:Porin subfamily protein [Symmachiella dynata]
MPYICRATSFILRTMLLAGVLLGLCAYAQGDDRSKKSERDTVLELSERIDTAESELRGLRRRLEELGAPQSVEAAGEAGVVQIGEAAFPEEEPALQTNFVRRSWQQGSSFMDSLQVVDGENLDPRFTNQQFEGEVTFDSRGARFYRSPDFDKGIIIEGEGAAMKIGGFVKADLIHDFDPIDSQDTFNPATIPIGAAPRQNTHFQANTSRLSFDTRWPTEYGTARAYIEGDFFSEGNRFRLRHAFGEMGKIIVGKTWTTFTDMRSLPQTLDFEGPVSGISRRQAQIRWTESIFIEELTWATALENPQVIFELPEMVQGEPRTESPDLVSHLRYTTDNVQLQAAGVIRQLGFQPTGQRVKSETAWGFNFTGYIQPTESDAAYYQILFGDGIGSYRGLPDVAPTGPTSAFLLPTFGWLVGYKHNWTEDLMSNFIYSQSRLYPSDFQSPDSLRETTYLAVNVIWNPTERFFMGVEYLYGTREDVDGGRGEANRIQSSFGFYLP